jgi:predicted ABC-type ATPase
VAKSRRGAPSIYVLAGTNGAGKSSIAGAMFRRTGADYFNPDEAARRIRAANPDMAQNEANAAAWLQGKRLLERAVSERLDFAIETTLGGSTIRGLLEAAIAAGFEVRMWYAGLASVEQHLERVRARVKKGGHDIPEEDIRRRYDAGRLNLIALLPGLTALRLYDNSAEADPDAGHAPAPRLILHTQRGKIVESCELSETPEWAKPIVAAAYRLAASL